MTQLSTTAVSRFQFRNRASFQEYSSYTHKSDFLSKMFLDFCQTGNARIPSKDDSDTQMMLREPREEVLCLGESGFLLPGLLVSEEGEGLPCRDSWLSAPAVPT